MLYVSCAYESSLKMDEAALSDKKMCDPNVRKQNMRKKGCTSGCSHTIRGVRDDKGKPRHMCRKRKRKDCSLIAKA